MTSDPSRAALGAETATPPRPEAARLRASLAHNLLAKVMDACAEADSHDPVVVIGKGHAEALVEEFANLWDRLQAHTPEPGDTVLLRALAHITVGNYNMGYKLVNRDKQLHRCREIVEADCLVPLPAPSPAATDV